MGSFEGSSKIAYFLTAFAVCLIAFIGHANATEKNALPIPISKKIPDDIKNEKKNKLKEFNDAIQKIKTKEKDLEAEYKIKTTEKANEINKAVEEIKTNVEWNKPIELDQHDAILLQAEGKSEMQKYASLKETAQQEKDIAEYKKQKADEELKEANKRLAAATLNVETTESELKEKKNALIQLKKDVSVTEMFMERVKANLTTIKDANDTEKKAKEKLKQEHNKMTALEPFVKEITEAQESLLQSIRTQKLLYEITELSSTSTLESYKQCTAKRFKKVIKIWSRIVYLSGYFKIVPEIDGKKTEKETFLHRRLHFREAQKKIDEQVLEMVNSSKAVYDKLKEGVTDDPDKFVELLKMDDNDRKTYDQTISERFDKEWKETVEGSMPTAAVASPKKPNGQQKKTPIAMMSSDDKKKLKENLKAKIQVDEWAKKWQNQNIVKIKEEVDDEVQKEYAKMIEEDHIDVSLFEEVQKQLAEPQSQMQLEQQKSAPSASSSKLGLTKHEKIKPDELVKMEKNKSPSSTSETNKEKVGDKDGAGSRAHRFSRNKK